MIRYRSNASPVEKSDLISAGNLGLIRAIEKYDWEKDNLFLTYAVLWIKRNQDRLAQSNQFLIQVPYHKRSDIHLHPKFINDFDKIVYKLDDKSQTLK